MSDARDAVLKAAAHYFETERKASKFIPGETYIPASGKSLEQEDLAALIEASLDLWLTGGRFEKAFEKELATVVGSSVPALFVNSGSSANLLAVSALGLKPGDEVITTAAAFPTTVNPIVQNRLIPVFVDIDLKTLNVKPESVFAAKTSKTKAVILAHTLGNPFDAKAIADWCEKEKLFFIEDACDALGATVGGRPVGSFGHYSTFSFYPAHQITTGEGGAVVARNGNLRRKVECLRDWGRDCWCETGKDNTCNKRFDWKLGDLPQGYDHKYTYSSIGYNLKATDIQAALGVSQLKKISKFVEARRRNYAWLKKAFEQSPLLKSKLEMIEATPGSEPSWFGFAVHCAPGVDRRKLLQSLEEKKIGTRLVFAGNLTKQPAYRGVDFRVAASLENTDVVMNRTFWLGLHPSLGELELSYVINGLERALQFV